LSEEVAFDRAKVTSGESSIRPVAAAIANAVLDASGVRRHRAPLTLEVETIAGAGRSD
jgi:CO/xanthine dehydrogenase Mo-binding subunit